MMRVNHGHFDWLVPVINLGWVEEPNVPRYAWIEGDGTYDANQRELPGDRWTGLQGSYQAHPDQRAAAFFSAPGSRVSGFGWSWDGDRAPQVYCNRHFPQPMPYEMRAQVGIPEWARRADPTHPGAFYHCCLQQSFRPKEFSCAGYNDPNLFIEPDGAGQGLPVRYTFFEDEPLERESDVIAWLDAYRLGKTPAS